MAGMYVERGGIEAKQTTLPWKHSHKIFVKILDAIQYCFWSHTCTYTHTHTHMHTHMHAPHIHMHTHTPTHTNTHKHTHRGLLCMSQVPLLSGQHLEPSCCISWPFTLTSSGYEWTWMSGSNTSWQIPLLMRVHPSPFEGHCLHLEYLFSSCDTWSFYFLLWMLWDE